MLGYLLVAGLVGCVATRSDLSAPSCWQEIEGEAVAVATADWMLPIVTDEKPENRWAAWFLVDTKRKVITVSPWDAPIRCTCRYCRTLYGHEVPDFVWGNDRVEFSWTTAMA